jgi:hypothetical protein
MKCEHTLFFELLNELIHQKTERLDQKGFSTTILLTQQQKFENENIQTITENSNTRISNTFLFPLSVRVVIQQHKKKQIRCMHLLKLNKKNHRINPQIAHQVMFHVKNKTRCKIQKQQKKLYKMNEMQILFVIRFLISNEKSTRRVTK